MREFWNKAKKELKVGWNSATKAVGIKKDQEDEGFLARAEKLDRIKKEYTGLLQAYDDWTRHMLESAGPAEAIYGYLKEPNDPLFTPRGIIAKWSNHELDRRCLEPLRAFALRFAEVDAIKQRRWRKRELMQASSGDELIKWTNSYTKYHEAFIKGADQLVVVWDRLFPHLVKSHRWIMQEMTKELEQFADQCLKGVPQPQIPADQGPDVALPVPESVPI